MKKPTVKDATKQEFIEFFTETQFGINGKWQFERWLSQKRYKVLDDKLNAIIDLMDESNKKMHDWSQKALNEIDSREKMNYYLKACECQEEWQRLNKQADKIQNEIDKFLGI